LAATLRRIRITALVPEDDFPPDIDSQNRDLFVMSLDGTYEQRVVNGPAVDRLLASLRG